MEKQKAKIHSLIQRSSDRHELENLIASIDFVDLQSILCDYVTNQKSPEKVAKLYHGSQSVLDIVGPDCADHVLGFLGYQDICSSSGVCKSFSDSLSSIKRSFKDRALLVNPTFIEFLFDEWNDTFVIGHTLQHQYDDATLNKFPFEEMGRRGMLGPQDMAIWKICHQYQCRFETNLVPCFIDDGPVHSSSVMCYNAPFGQQHSVVSPQWNALKGTHHLTMDEFASFAAVQIKCPDRLWRDDFVSRNLSGNIFEFLLSVHPLFAEYREWSESSDHLIGYCSPLDMYDSLGIPSHSFAELGRRGELQGMDMIIWRLCNHFGFEMTSFLMIEDGGMYGVYECDGTEGCVMEWDKITHGQFDRAIIDWNTSDWYQPSWNKVWSDPIPKKNGIEVWGEQFGIKIIFTAHPVLQIRCRKQQKLKTNDLILR